MRPTTATPKISFMSKEAGLVVLLLWFLPQLCNPRKNSEVSRYTMSCQVLTVFYQELLWLLPAFLLRAKCTYFCLYDSYGLVPWEIIVIDPVPRSRVIGIERGVLPSCFSPNICSPTHRKREKSTLLDLLERWTLFYSEFFIAVSRPPGRNHSLLMMAA